MAKLKVTYRPETINKEIDFSSLEVGNCFVRADQSLDDPDKAEIRVKINNELTTNNMLNLNTVTLGQSQPTAKIIPVEVELYYTIP
jgi:hypothetical protein